MGLADQTQALLIDSEKKRAIEGKETDGLDGKGRGADPNGAASAESPSPMPETIHDIIERSRIISKSYTGRQSVLRLIGFRNYNEYLESELWAEIRDAALSNSPLCAICRAQRATQIHHQSYKKTVMTGRNFKALIPVCRFCHHTIEFTDDGEKRTFHEAVKYCKRLLRRWPKERRGKRKKRR